MHVLRGWTSMWKSDPRSRSADSWCATRPFDKAVSVISSITSSPRTASEAGGKMCERAQRKKSDGSGGGGGDSCVLGESVLNVLMAGGEACTSDTYTTTRNHRVPCQQRGEGDACVCVRTRAVWSGKAGSLTRAAESVLRKAQTHRREEKFEGKKGKEALFF